MITIDYLAGTLPALSTAALDFAQRLEDACYDTGCIDPEEDLRTDYSGRGMFGDSCIGIVGSDSDLIAFVIAWCEASEDDNSWLQGVRSDGMGLQTIYYWPGVQAEGAPERA